MKEDINYRIVQKIREQLQNHEEEYQEGAWENFLAKKKEKKRRMLFWYFRGVAASIVILLAIGLLFNDKTPQDLNNRNIITEEKPKERNNSLEKQDIIKQESLNKIKRSVIADTEDTNNQNNTDSLFKDKSWGAKPMNNNNGIANNKIRTQNTSPDKKNVQKKKPFQNKNGDVNVAIIATNNQSNILNEKETLKNDNTGKNESVVSLIKKAIKEFEILPVENLKVELSQKEKQDIIVINLDDFIEDTKDNENKKESNKKKIEIGLLFSPSYGSGTENNKSIASSSLGAGLALNIPINNSNISFSTGATFNELSVTNDRTIKTGAFSSANETIDHNETNLYNIDIPLNLTYNISNNKIYVQAGVSSYLTFKENIDLSSTFVREVEVFHFNDGVVETFTTTESVTTKETSKNEEVKFQPLGTINLSFGYRARLSNKLIYEIQPFYKYPLNALTSQDDKTHTAGIALKLFFSK